MPRVVSKIPYSIPKNSRKIHEFITLQRRNVNESPTSRFHVRKYFPRLKIRTNAIDPRRSHPHTVVSVRKLSWPRNFPKERGTSNGVKRNYVAGILFSSLRVFFFFFASLRGPSQRPGESFLAAKTISRARIFSSQRRRTTSEAIGNRCLEPYVEQKESPLPCGRCVNPECHSLCAPCHRPRLFIKPVQRGRNDGAGLNCNVDGR